MNDILNESEGIRVQNLKNGFVSVPICDVLIVGVGYRPSFEVGGRVYTFHSMGLEGKMTILYRDITQDLDEQLSG